MELAYKPDLDCVLERFEAWWERQIVDRPLVTVRVAERPQREAPTARQRHWFDFDRRLDEAEAAFASTVFLAETLPMFMPDMGPDLCSALFGCELEFNDHSGWSKPCMSRIRDVLKVQPNFEAEPWRQMRELTRRSLQRGEGRWLTALTDLHTNGDLLAALRDPQELCLDMADDPESVRLACEHVTDSFAAIYDDNLRLFEGSGQPVTTWTPALHAGAWYPLSCDFICMISPAQFAQTTLPSIQREQRRLSRSIFHLDGPGALKHLDLVLDIDGLDALQWVYGAGATRASDWIGVYQRAQARGKALQVLCVDVPDALVVMEHLRPEGCWFCLRDPLPRRNAEAFIEAVTRWGAGQCV